MKKKDNKAKQEAKAKKQEAKAKKQEAKAKKQAEKKEAKAKKQAAKKEAKAKKQKEQQAAKAKKQEAKAKKQAAKKGKDDGANEGGKRRLNMKVVIPLVILLAAGGAGAFFFLKGGEELQPPTAYVIAEESTIVLDGFLEEGGKIKAITLQQPEGEAEEEEAEKEDEKQEEKAENSENAEPQPVPVDTIALYDYIGVTPAALEQYLDALLAEDQGFVMVDENYNEIEQRPVFAEAAEDAAADDKDAEDNKDDKKDDKEDKEAESAMAAGTILLAREASVEGRLFQVRLTWTAEGECNVEVSCPEAAFPEEPMMNSTGALDYIKGQRPSDLGLPGDSMAQYNIYNQEGSVVLDGRIYRKFIVYELDEVTHTNAYVGEFLMSGDGRTVYKRDENGELQRVK